MAKLKKDILVITIAVLLLAVLAILYFIATWGIPTNDIKKDADTKLVLQISSLGDSSTDNTTPFWYTEPYYNVNVLDSNDLAIKNGTNCMLQIHVHPKEDIKNHDTLSHYEFVTPKELVPDTIISITNTDLCSITTPDNYVLPMRTSNQDYYCFENNTIVLGIGSDYNDNDAWDNAWKQKITVIYTPIANPLENETTIGNDSSNNNVTVALIINADTLTPSPYSNPDRLIINRNGTSILFNTDNISWYQYIVTLQINNETRHKKLDVDYTRGQWKSIDGMEYTYNRTNVWNVWPDDNNASSYSIQESDLGGNKVLVEGSSGANIQEGVKVYGSISLMGDVLKGARENIISTRFDGDTDSAMKLKGFDNIRLKGESYNCTVYEVNADNDTYTVWHNASIPIPLKIITNYQNPEHHLYYFGSWYRVSTVSKQYTYDLADWGTTKENMPFPT